jgi:hypothetical protein
MCVVPLPPRVVTATTDLHCSLGPRICDARPWEGADAWERKEGARGGREGSEGGGGWDSQGPALRVGSVPKQLCRTVASSLCKTPPQSISFGSGRERREMSEGDMDNVRGN